MPLLLGHNTNEMSTVTAGKENEFGGEVERKLWGGREKYGRNKPYGRERAVPWAFLEEGAAGALAGTKKRKQC
jgi:hypothetical protein